MRMQKVYLVLSVPLSKSYFINSLLYLEGGSGVSLVRSQRIVYAGRNRHIQSEIQYIDYRVLQRQLRT